MVEGVWRSGNRMVMSRDAELPDRCVKTNAPARGRRLSIVLRWHERSLYLMLLLGPIFYLILAAFISKWVRVRVGISERMLKARRRVRALLLGVLLCAALLWLAAAVGSSAALVIAAVAATILLAVPIYLMGRTTIWATRIESGYIWIAGVHPDYLASLPQWPLD